MNLKCLLCPNVAKWYYETLAFRFCDIHKNKWYKEPNTKKKHITMTRIPFVSDLGMLKCLRCDYHWTPSTFFLKPDEKNESKRYRALKEYMQIQKNCPLCRSPRWMLPHVRRVPAFRKKKRAPWRRLIEQSIIEKARRHE